jgi:acetylornithine aminotransferase
MSADAVIASSRTHEFGVYARQPVVFARGRGCELWDTDGKRYLDFFAGLAVNNLGHCHPAVVSAVQEQAATLLHTSNVYFSLPATELCARLCRHSFAERVFLCNSGAEANEAAMKLARRWGSSQSDGRYEILSTTGSFHGRTFGTLTATGQEKYHTGFLPLLPGIRHVPFGDLAAMRDAVRPETVAIMVEPIQGEGGVVVPPADYLPGLRALADEKNLLLIFDEVQCGLGRTGKLFAYEHAGITPDIMTLAKALGGGMPIGAMCTTAKIASAFTPGAHGTTFGGNPVASAAACAALQVLADDKLLANVRTMGDHFRHRLEALAGRGGIKAVRGVGLMWGAELDRPGANVVKRCLEEGLLSNCTADRVLRFLPPLVIRRAQIDEGFGILERAITT